MQAINIKKIVIAGAGVLSAVAVSSANAAAAVDLTAITGAVSATDITTGVLAIGAVMAVVWVTVKAVKIVMGFLKSA
ncbi:hypothetical protein [Herbaspirillum huttiense]|uniref:hypothetical protein n=1 Tax=Herbaspirillum huttiense TaxID=863372 RepID=UPI0031E2F303